MLLVQTLILIKGILETDSCLSFTFELTKTKLIKPGQGITALTKLIEKKKNWCSKNGLMFGSSDLTQTKDTCRKYIYLTCNYAMQILEWMFV